MSGTLPGSAAPVYGVDLFQKFTLERIRRVAKSEEEAKAFLKKVCKDKELGEQLKGADSEEKFFAVAKGAGFEFTKEEWILGSKKQKNRRVLKAIWDLLKGGTPRAFD